MCLALSGLYPKPCQLKQLLQPPWPRFFHYRDLCDLRQLHLQLKLLDRRDLDDLTFRGKAGLAFQSFQVWGCMVNHLAFVLEIVLDIVLASVLAFVLAYQNLDSAFVLDIVQDVVLAFVLAFVLAYQEIETLAEAHLD